MARFGLGLLVVAAAALVAALPATAKEGVKATVETKIPLDTPAGTQLAVSWSLAGVDDQGRRQPFGASGVFVRLVSASGGAATTGVAPVGAHSTGQYRATVVVPEGGIGDIEIGLRGWSTGPTGRHRADVLFPITNDPLPGAARATAPASGQSGSPAWIFILVAGSLLMSAVLAALLVRRRRASRGPEGIPA
jgi:hypothetical protein